MESTVKLLLFSAFFARKRNIKEDFIYENFVRSGRTG